MRDTDYMEVSERSMKMPPRLAGGWTPHSTEAGAGVALTAGK